MKRLITIVVSILLGTYAYAQPANNACGGATNLSVSSSGCVYTASTNVAATAGANDCDGNAVSDDVWFTFNMASSDDIKIMVTPDGSGFDPVIELFYDLSCPATSSAVCENSTPAGESEQIYINALSGAWYFRVYSADNNQGSFQVCVRTTDMDNDECGSETALTVGAAATRGFIDEIHNTAASPGVTGCAGTGDDDVWYSFTTDASPSVYKVTVDILDKVGLDPVIAVYSGGACGSLTEINCTDATFTNETEVALLSGLSASTTYKVRVHNWYDTEPTELWGGDFTIRVEEVSPPANNTCAASDLLTPAASCVSETHTSENATASGEITEVCGFNADDDVWFHFTANNTTQEIRVTNPSSSYDAVIEAYSGSCGSLTNIGCIDATFSGDAETLVLTGLTTSTVYKVRVFHYYTGFGGTGEGQFDICVVGIPAPDNDDCANAKTITVNSSCTGGFANETTEGGNPSTDQTFTQCSGDGSDDVWYKFVANNESQEIKVSNIDATFDPVIHLFSGSCGSLTPIECQEGNGVGADDALTVAGLTIGDTYYIRIYNSANGTTTGEFDICVEGTAPSNTAYDDPCNAFDWPTLTSSCNFRTFDNTNNTSSGVTVNNFLNRGASTQDIWIKFTAPASELVEIYTMEANGGSDMDDPTFNVYVENAGCGSVGSADYVSGNDDEGTGYSNRPLDHPYVKLTNADISSGDIVYVRLDNRASGSAGEVRLCISTPVNDNCSAALNLCNINGYSGTTSPAYTVDQEYVEGCSGGAFGVPGTSCANGTSIENNSWLSFQPNAPTATFDISIEDCWKGTDGIQFQILEGTCDSGFVPVSSFVQTATSQKLTATGLTIGETYYIMIDGWAGDICNYTISGSAGVAASSISSVDAEDGVITICEGGSTTLTANFSGAGTPTFAWSSVPVGGPYASTSSITVTPTVTTKYTCTIGGLCGGADQSASQTVSVNAKPAAPTVSGTTSLCGILNTFLTANSVTSGVTSYRWYDAAVNGNLLHTGVGFSPQLQTGNYTTTFYVEAVNNKGCSSNRTQVDIDVDSGVDGLTWLGTTSTDWFNAANWGGCLPDCNTNVIIPNVANDPNIGAGTARAKNITLESGAELDLTSASSILEICGSFEHSGVLSQVANSNIKFKGINQQEYSKTGSGSFYNIELSNSNGILIKDGSSYGDLSVTNQFTFTAGKVFTEGNRTLHIENTSTSSITGYDNDEYVVGRLKRDVTGTGAYDFPMGNTDSYQLMNIDFSSKDANLDDVTVYFKNLDYGTKGLPLDDGANHEYDRLANIGGTATATGNAVSGYWTVTPDEGSATYDVTLYGRNYDNAINAGSYTVAKRNTPNSCDRTYTNPGAVAANGESGGVINAKRTGITGFSQFAILANKNILPVELGEFTSNCKNGKVTLNWLTYSESNTYKFIIERSRNGINDFKPIGTVDAEGNSTETNNYNFSVSNGQGFYYRLKIVDFDGSYEYSNLVKDNCSDSKGMGQFISLFPNPAENNSSIVFTTGKSEKVTLRILNELGQIVEEHSFTSNKELNNVQLDLSYYAEGAYTVAVIGETETMYHRLIKTK